MVRTHGRIWIGIAACLLMLAGLLGSAVPVSAQAHPATGNCPGMMETHCLSHQQPSPATDHAHHKDPCCHVHVCAPDLSSPAALLRPAGLTGTGRPDFAFHRQTHRAGGDWLPPLRPPRIQNS